MALQVSSRLSTSSVLYEALVGTLREGVLGCTRGADECMALLARQAMQPLAPHLTLLIPEYVTAQLDQISDLQYAAAAT